MIKVRSQSDAATFAVKVHPSARRERISGTIGDSLKLDLTAPPAQGRANEACIRFFAELLKVPRSSVTIAAGISSRNKVIRIEGMSVVAIERVIAAALSE